MNNCPEDISFNADNYLRFLVEKLSLLLIKNILRIRVLGILLWMGSSMGGLISLYALCD